METFIVSTVIHPLNPVPFDPPLYFFNRAPPVLQKADNVIILFRLVDNTISGTSGENGVVTVMQDLTKQASYSH